MVVTDGDQSLARTFQEGGSVEDRRACIPGSGSAGQFAREGKDEKVASRWSPNSGRTNFARLQTVQGQLDQAGLPSTRTRLGNVPKSDFGREAELRAAEAKLANAKTEFDRCGRLVKTSAVSRAEYELSETAYRVARGRAKGGPPIWLQEGGISRKEDIDRIQQAALVRSDRGDGWPWKRTSDQRTCTLRAPYDGVSSPRRVRRGESDHQCEQAVWLATPHRRRDRRGCATRAEAAIGQADVRSAAITQMRLRKFSTVCPAVSGTHQGSGPGGGPTNSRPTPRSP